MTPDLPDTYSKEEKEEIERRHQRLLDAWQTRKEAQDLEMVNKAFYFAVEAHKDQRRRSGEPYIYHPIEEGAIVMKPSSVTFGHPSARSTAAGTSSGLMPSFDRSPLMLTSRRIFGRAPISSATR